MQHTSTARDVGRPSSTRRKIAIFAGVIVVAVLSGIAYAWFSSTGTGTGNATVGTSSSWAVATQAPAGDALLPGYGSQTIAYSVTNTGSGQQKLLDTSAALTQDAAGDVYNTTTSSTATGCKASWYTVLNTKPALVNLAGGATQAGGVVTITMRDSNTNQDACKIVSPQVTINAI